MLNQEKGPQYQPKGGLCISCDHCMRDCSRLKFEDMRVIELYDNTKIVKCHEYKHTN